MASTAAALSSCNTAIGRMTTTGTSEPRAGSRVLIVGSMANVAGAPIAAMRLAHGFRERGHEVSAIFLYERAPVPSPPHPYDVLARTDSPTLKDYLAMARGIFALVRREKPDVVVSFLPLAHILAQSAALLNGVGRRIVSHRVPIDTYGSPLRQINMLFAWIGVYTGVSAVSKATLASCADYPKRLLQRATTIPNALLDWPKPTVPRAAAREALGFSNGQVVLAAVGRLAEQKNYGVLVEVMAKLDERFVLAIAGDGPLRAQMEARIEQAGLSARIKLLGPLPRLEVANLLEACDIYVMPSLFEGHSNALLEALAADKPIIAHDIAEQREVLIAADGQLAGILVPVDKVDDWVSAIRMLDSDPGLAAQLRNVGRAQNQVFSFKRMMDQYEALIGA